MEVTTISIAGGYKDTIAYQANNSFIGGGSNNSIQGPYCVIAGGDTNEIRNDSADHNFIGGGEYNIEDNPSWGVIGGGYHNYLDIMSWGSAITGGINNTIHSSHNFIGGGSDNVIQFYDDWSAIAGGEGNQIWRGHGFIGGGYHNFVHAGVGNGYSALVGGYTDSLKSNYGFLGGGRMDIIDYGSDYSVIGGGDSNYINGERSVIGGGCNNQVHKIWGTIAGGCMNQTYDTLTFIGGGTHNIDSAITATIGGGSGNRVSGNSGFIGGGIDNSVLGIVGTIGGGQIDTIYGSSEASLIGGGDDNVISSSNVVFHKNLGTLLNEGGFTCYNGFNMIGGGITNKISGAQAVITGGVSNLIDTNTVWSCILGGTENEIKTSAATIAGGENNFIDTGAYNSFIGAGESNADSAGWSSLAGGFSNTIRPGGVAAAIPGGLGLVAKSYAQFVAGRFNLAQGTSTFASIGVDDPLAIFGNGIPGVPSNAFEVTNDGYTVAYHHAPLAESITVGGTYQNNTIESWGNIPAGAAVGFPFPLTPISGVGILNVNKTANGVYVITLHTKGPDGLGYTLSAGSVTVTVQDSPEGSVCAFATATAITGNVFTVTLHGTDCKHPDLPFCFKVCGQ